MRPRATFVLLALLGIVAGQNPKPSAAKGPQKGRGAAKGPGRGRGTPATPPTTPAPADQPELHKLRDEMRRSWCAGGRNAESSPCKMEAFLTKYRAETDAAKKKELMSASARSNAPRLFADHYPVPSGAESAGSHRL